MPLIPKAFSAELFTFIKSQQSSTVSDPEKATKDFCDKLEELIDKRIISANYTVLPGVTFPIVTTAGAGTGTLSSPLVAKAS